MKSLWVGIVGLSVLATKSEAVGYYNLGAFWQSGASQFAGGDEHSCTIMQGNVYCWGANAYGQLGSGNTVDRSTPTAIAGLSQFSSVAAGRDFSLAMSSDGSLFAWGKNFSGQLGDGTTVNRLTQVPVLGITSLVTGIAAGGQHACAIVNGGVRCWGSNLSGQLGNLAVVGGASTLVSDNFDDNSMDNAYWQLQSVTSGVTVSEQNQRLEIPLIPNSSGQNGYKTKTAFDFTGKQVSVELVQPASSGCSNTYLSVDLDSTRYLNLHVGSNQIYSDYQISNQGFSSRNPLSDASNAHRFFRLRHDVASDTLNWEISSDRVNWTLLRTEPRGFAITAVNSSIFAFEFCSFANPGTAYFDNFRIESSDAMTSATAVGVSGLSSGVVQVATGAYHSCALTSAGGVKCWGDNAFGQLGDGTTVNRTTAAYVTGLSSGVTSLVASDMHSCALLNGGTPRCWGYNFSGQLGDGSTVTRLTPVAVSGLTSQVSQLTVGGTWWNSSAQGEVFRAVYREANTCALHNSQGLKCWGSNLQGQLGNWTPSAPVLTEDFNDNTMDTALWSLGDTTVGVVEQNQRLEITLPVSTAGTHVGGYYSNSTYDLTGRAVSFEVVQFNNNSAGASSGLALKIDSNNYYSIWNNGGNLNLEWVQAGSSNKINYGTYLSSAQRFLRIRHDATSDYINWESSSNGVQWFTLWRAARVLAITGLQIVLSGSTTGSVASPGVAIFDNLRLQATPNDSYVPVSVTGLTSSTLTLGQSGARHNCVLVGASVRCWGSNGKGQLGDGSTVNRSTSAWVPGL